MANLTTLANAEGWIDLTPGTNLTTDALVTRLIAAASGMILAYIGRPSVLPQSYTETRDGTGSQRLILRRWPVTAITTLLINGTAIPVGSYPPSGAGGAIVTSDGDFLDVWDGSPPGYYFEAWDGMPPGRRIALELSGFSFYRGPQNISISYTAGYLVSNEAATVNGAGTPANSVAVQAPWGSWATDQGVTYANGTALTATTGAPAAGQYQLSTTTPGIYIFNSADAGKDVLISYGFIPSVIEEACCQLVAERYSYRSRVGSRTKSLGGSESMSYDRSPMAPEVKAMLAPYRAVASV